MKKNVVVGNSAEFSLVDESFLKNKVYTIRGVKVMLDADLAEIYGYSTKDFNRQVKNNIERFPEFFRFQLTVDEIAELSRCKNCTSMQIKGVKGGRVYLPYAFTEQGIYMLMTVLKGELAIKQSIAIMLLFKEMKDYIVAENQQLLGADGLAQLGAQTALNTREIGLVRQDLGNLSNTVFSMQDDLQKVMDNFIDPNTYKHYLIMNGQKLEADIAYTQIYALAKKSIYVIDEYVCVKTLDLLRGVPEGLEIMIFSDQWGRQVLTEAILADFRAARPDLTLSVRSAMGIFHDRYVFIDYNEENEILYHCGPSSKDAGNRVATVATLEFKDLYHPLMDLLLKEA
ncbi:MAG: ORF6N domain-containing protein [Fibrobacter sp.]|nr:ORF6N domain-containing protein [Fibrobacter sp.]